MKYNFSTQFLKIIPPQSTFGDAWEALCTSLLQSEYGYENCLPMKAPDRGVDIILRAENKAIQCKADERGAIGTIAPTKSIESLKTALTHREHLSWSKYIFASNANYSGSGIEKILEFADNSSISKSDISFLGPEYWSDLCDRHLDKVKHMLDYRLLYSEKEVEEAFKKARYFDKYIDEFSGLIKNENLRLEVSNNRTPIVLSIPFSKELSVKECLEVCKSLLGVDLKKERYSDLGTTAKPSLSLTLDGKAQPFSKKICEFSEEELGQLKLWIKIVYGVDDDRQRDPNSVYLEMLIKTTSTISKSEARQSTLQRFESSIQQKMWEQVTLNKSMHPTADAAAD